jgi:hypothetical protein
MLLCVDTLAYLKAWLPFVNNSLITNYKQNIVLDALEEVKMKQI